MTPPTPDSELRNKLEAELLRFHKYMRQCELVADNNESHTLAKDAIENANQLPAHFADQILTLFHQHQASAVERARKDWYDRFISEYAKLRDSIEAPDNNAMKAAINATLQSKERSE